LIDRSDDCCIWLLGKDKDGYGKIKVNGKHLRAHRLSYEMHVGPIPSGLLVLHTCDVPECVNPEHLWIGTVTDNNPVTDNNRDREVKGRGRYYRRRAA